MTSRPDPFEDPQPPVRSEGFDMNRSTIISLLYLASFVVGITGLAGIVLAYVWRGEAPQTWERSHYTYHIRTFWLGLLGMVIGIILTAVLIGIIVLMAVAVWVLIRSIIALLKAQKQEPMPNPNTLGF